MERRKFIRNSISFSLLIGLHKQAQAYDQITSKSKNLSSQSCRFPEITLYTSKLKEQQDFYSKTLECPLVQEEKDQFAVQVGESLLRFKEADAGTEPFYHYAINIPSNKHLEAKEWLKNRTPLLQDSESGGDLLYFGFWDAHAMYFKDPAGNIGELIARHTLENDREGEFAISDLLCVSEIGTPVENPQDFAAELVTAYDLERYGSSMFVGDENGLFVIPPIDRLWIPENIQKAAVYPAEIYVNDPGQEQFKFQDYPYDIRQRK